MKNIYENRISENASDWQRFLLTLVLVVFWVAGISNASFAQYNVTGTNVCFGSEASISLNQGDNNEYYYLLRTTDNVNYTFITLQVGQGPSVVLNYAKQTVVGKYVIYHYTNYTTDISTILSGTKQTGYVEIFANPVPGLTGATDVCAGSLQTYTTETGKTDYTWTVNGGTGTPTSNSIAITWGSEGAGSVSVNYKDGNGCTAPTATVLNVTKTDAPDVSAVSLQSTINKTIYQDLLGSLAAGFTMPLYGCAEYTYLDVTTLTASVDVKADFLHPFYLNQTSLPTGWSDYWAAKGVVSGATGWQGEMYKITTGAEPIFYLKKTGSDYMLVDGLQLKIGEGEQMLRISGDYPLGTFKYDGQLYATDGCYSNLSINMTFERGILNVTQQKTYATIGAAIVAASDNNVIKLCAGTYTENININKPLIINGPNAGIAGTGVREAEAVLLNSTIDINNAGNTTLDGLYIKRTDGAVGFSNQLELDGGGTNTVQNCIFERFGSNTEQLVRAIATTTAGGPKVIQNNKITGDVSGGLFSGHKTWNNGIYIDAGSFTVNVSGNTVENCRTAINVDDYNNNVTIADNTFNNNGTHISIGGNTIPSGSFVLGANNFINNDASTMVNLSQVAESFRFDITSSTLNGVSFSALPNATLFEVESRMAHKEVSASKKGKVIYKANNQYVNNFTTPIIKIDKIQNSIKYGDAGDIINLEDGTYNEKLTIDKSNLTLQGVTNDNALYVIDGTGLGATSGIYLNNGITKTTIKDLTVQNFTGTNPNSYAGIYAIGGNNNLTVKNTTLQNNIGGSGFYANGPITDVLLDYVTASGHTNVAGAARGIVIWNGLKSNITITNCEVFNNNCCGIELQDGTASGVTMSNNKVYDNGDSGMSAVGLMAGSGPNVISNNTLNNNGRFGIEIKNPNGTGATSGDGSIVISDNTVSMTSGIADLRDMGGILVFRRGVLAGNVDIPTGVVVQNNSVSGYTQASTSDGFGIVVEGTNHNITGNILNNNDVGIQQQAGHTPYPADGDQANVADLYFGRGNSPELCNVTASSNAYSGNGTDERIVTGGGTGTVQTAITPTLNDPADQIICAGESSVTTFTGNYSSGVVYNWTNTNTAIGLDASGSGNISFVTQNSTGVTQVATITVTPTANGCAGTPQTFTITVKPMPTLTSVVPSQAAVCAGTPVSFTANGLTNGVNEFNYTVTGPGGPFNGTQTATITGGTYTFAAATYPEGTYNITINSIKIDGCTTTLTSGNTTSFTVNTPVAITSVTAAKNPICATETTTLTANGVFGTNATVTWYDGPNGTGTQLGTGLTLAGVTSPKTYYAHVTGVCGIVEASFTLQEDGPVKNETTGRYYCNIQDAIDAPQTVNGNTINVDDGTYVLISTLNIGKELSIIGATQAGTKIDVSAVGGYGLDIHASNVTLKNFTILPNASTGTYAIKANPNGASPFSNLALDYITINGSKKTAFDIHGYDNVSLKNLTATNTLSGNGISLSGCNGVTMTGITTSNNTWGGIAVYVSKPVYVNRGSYNIAFDFAANSIGEYFYVEDESGLVNSNITVANWTFGINNDYSPTANFTVYQNKTKADALSFGAALNSKFSNKLSYVWDPSVTTHHVGPGMSIQRAIDMASTNYLVDVAAGTYNENVVLNQSVTLKGAGTTTILTPATACAGAGITIAASGVKVQDLKVTNYTTGLVVSASNAEITNVESVLNCNRGMEITAGVANLKLIGSKLNNNLTGIFGGTESSVDGLLIENCEISNNTFGTEIYQSSSAPVDFKNVTVKNSTLSNNARKGMYFEKLSDALFTDLVMANNGTDATCPWNNGIDINLKYKAYSNITIRNSELTNSGYTGTANLADNPVVIAVKARDDAPSYNSIPASLSNVTIQNNIISGPQNGIRFGEFGKTNAGPTNVIVTNNDLSATFANKAIINNTNSNITANCNWWGATASATIAAKIGGLGAGVTNYNPWITSAGDGAALGFQPTGSCTGTPVVIASATPDHIICSETEGSVEVIYSGGTADYTVSWTGMETGSEVDIDDASPFIIPNLSAGNYTIKITDANGSSDEITAVVKSLPVTLKDATLTLKDYYPTIQAAITAATAGDVIEVCAGTYAEDIVVSKQLDIRGPKYGIAGNDGSRGTGEAIIHPVNTTNSGDQIVYLESTASGTSINGFTFDGDNPLLTSGVLMNGKDVDVLEALSGYHGLANVIIRNNVIKNLNYAGIDFYNYYNNGAATTGNTIENNLFDNIVPSEYGIGVIIYNNCYTNITNNVMTRVRVGIQTGNFYKADPGSSRSISNNILEVNRRGIFHNLAYSNASAFTLSGNVITASSTGLGTDWDGILLSSLSVPSNSVNNTINGPASAINSQGYEIWNVKSNAPAAISGGNISNIDIGIFANNYEGYSSNGSDGAHAVVSGVTITPKTGGVGVKAYDSPSYTGTNTALVSVEVKDNCTISGAAIGIIAEGADASVTVTNNLATITGNQVGILVKDGADLASVTGNTITNNTHGGIIIESTAGTIGVINNNTISGNGNSVDAVHGLGLKNELATVVDAINNWWGDASGPYHATYNTCGSGNAVVGLVNISPWLNGAGGSPVALPIENVTKGTFYCKIQDAISDAVTADGDVIRINAADFTEPGQILVTKSLTLTGLGKTSTILRCNINTGTGHANDASAWILTSAGKDVTIKDMTIDGTGKSIWTAVRFKSDGQVDNVSFNEIKMPTYYGIAVQVQNGDVDVTNCTFTNIGRIGAHFRNGVISGAVISGSFANNTYTGKGDGDKLDYAVDISGGTTVVVSNNMVTGNTGVASTDGSTSAGLLVTSYYPIPANSVANSVTVTGNTLTGNTTGLAVGYNSADVSLVVASGNKISGNTWGVTSTGPSVNATGNWWGAVTGPTYAGNPCGTGDAISDNVIYDCWKGDDALTTNVCQLQAYTVNGTGSVCVGSTTANITLSGSQTNVVYDLYANGVNAGLPQNGSGSPLTWTVTPTANTIYTVKAKNNLSLCELPMTGSATIYYGPVTTAASFDACPGTDITVPITVKSFSEVRSISLKLKYDTRVMTFSNDWVNNTITFGSGDVFEIPSGEEYFNVIIIGKSASGGSNFPTIPENGALLSLKFHYKNGTGSLQWMDLQDVDCEYSYKNEEIAELEEAFCDGVLENTETADPDYYVNGTITENTYLSSYIAGLDKTLEETFNYSPACIASGDEISSISGTGAMVEFFEELASLPAGIVVIDVAGYTLTGNPVTDGANIKAKLIALMEAANPANNTVGGLNNLAINVPVIYANTNFTGCEQTAVFVITFHTEIPDAQQAMETFVANQVTTITENFKYAPSCIASSDLISSISGTGTMVALIAGLPTTVDVVKIAGYTMTGDDAADMLGIKNALTALMIAKTTNGTVGELDGNSISFDVVYANKLNASCTQTLGYTINFNTDIPDAQQSLEEYVTTVPKTATENFAGLCLEGNDLISEISGTGKMVDLFSQIANLQSGGQIVVVSVANIAYTGTPANMAAIAVAIKALMIAETTNGTIHELDGKSISIPVVFANALNAGCTSLVNFVFKFDTAIPDQPLTVTCPANISVYNTPGSCDASVSFEATASAGESFPINIVYKIGGTEINSPYTFPVGTTTVNVTASNQCKTVECSFTVTVIDNQKPTITCPANVTVQVNASSNPSATGFATASDNCTASPVITFSDVWAAGSCVGTGIITRTWTAKDAANNTQTCSQTITIIDTETPAITCPSDITAANDAGKCEAVVTFDSPVSYDQGYNEGWESATYVSGDNIGWSAYNSNVISVASGTNGITSASGGYHGLTQNPVSGQTGVFSRIGGYNSSFGNGYRVRQSVYMDLNDPAVTANTYGWDLSAASSRQNGAHLRDFIFHTASNASGQILVAVSNNSNFTRRNDLASQNPYTITSSGWYTFEWVFRNNAGVLAVDLNLLNNSNTVLWTKTLSNSVDLIATVVGGNRYLWFTFLAVENLAIDNTSIERLTSVNASQASGTSFPVGTTPVTITSTDACGNPSTCTFNVKVNDTEKPAITLLGNSPEYVCQGSAYVDAGATATDNCGGIITGSIATGGLPINTAVPGDYTVTYNVSDAAGNPALQVIRIVTVRALPVVNTVALQTSTDEASWTAIDGTLAGGYEMCVDPVIPYNYYDINTLTSSVDLKTTDFVQNAFYLSQTGLPADFFTYWAAKGVNSSATGWQGVMWQIINGNAPMFYIQKDGTDYKLIDGLQYQIGQGAQTLRISGDYPAGDYKFTGTVTDVNGCVSLPFNVMLKLNSAPVITCPANIEVSNDATKCGADVTFVATATGVPAATIVYTLADNTVITSPHYFPVGTTTVKATASNTCKTVSCTFTVTVNDTEKPVITLLGNATEYVCQNSPYTDAGATAIDNCGGNLTASISVVNPVTTATPGTYTVTYDVSDGALNAAVQVTRTVTVRALPVVNKVALQTSTDESGWSAISGTLAAGYVMCIDPVIPYHYYDINTLTSTEVLLSSAFVQNAFKLDVTSVPAGFYAYWDGRGVNASAASGTWQAVMYQIITGAQPMFYIQKDGADYKLIDGLQYQFANVVKTLRINGEYPAGDYKFRGTVTDVNGCVSLPFDVMLKLNSAPVITCPANITVSNTPGRCDASVTFAATATGVPAATIVYTLADNTVITSPHIFPVGTTTVTATASNTCKTVSCTFDVTVVDDQVPVITCPVSSNQNVFMNQTNGCTYVHSGTGWNATATDNCTPDNNITVTAMLSGATNSGPHTSLAGVTFESGITTVTWRATDAAGKFTECTFTVTVTGVTLNGTIKYHNNANTPLANVEIKLLSGTTEVTTVPTATDGTYSFSNVCPGTYDVVITVNKSTAGALNVTDAAQVNSWFVNQNSSGIHTPSIEKVRFLAGDVSGSAAGNQSFGDFYLDADDAATIQRYFVTGGTQFQLAPQWEFWHASVIINTQQDDPGINNVLQVTIPAGVGTATQNFLAMVSGDFNKSFVPSANNKSGSLTGSSTLTLNQGENIEVLPSTTVDLPLKAETAMQVGAISLILDYPFEKLEVENVFLRNNPEQPVMFAIVDDELRIGWNSMEPISLAAGETMLTVRLKTTSIITDDEVCRFKLSADPLNELADGSYEVIQNASLKVDGLKLAKNVTTGIEIPDLSSQMLLTAYPNPFREYAKIKYTLPEDGTVKIEVTGILGNRVRELTNQQQTAGEYMMNLDGNNIVPGVYQITLRFKSQYGKELTQTIRMVKQ